MGKLAWSWGLIISLVYILRQCCGSSDIILCFTKLMHMFVCYHVLSVLRLHWCFSVMETWWLWTSFSC